MTNYSNLNQPESIPKVFAEAWNNRDAKKLASLFDEDASFVNVTGLWWHNRNDIEKAHAYGLRTIFNTSTLSIIRTEVKYLAENIAVVQAKVRLTGQTSFIEVSQPGQRRTIFTFVVHKEGEEWSCAAAHNTDIVPNMETHIRDGNNQLIPVDYRKAGNSSENS
ncbi:YybH family protein [Pontibacter silvestris]|uniref:YybH family protein n=1 Tax=Pontibacter silvestris TaxID=2305183 RepID=A0ABW4X0N2_9BACT|nr:SgcJ/EcaC family oxidoreductase [Pontibacter silvestris]MCC9135484.1 SgcJ/EcaC family oxidoreductase [Pontibacter silvestris]